MPVKKKTEKKPTPAIEFILGELKKNKKAAYADIRAKAEKKKLKIYPIMYGRAKAMLGLVKVAPRGKGKTKKKATPRSPRARATGGSKSAQVRSLLRSGMSAAEIAKKVGCTVGLVYGVKSKAGGVATKRGPGRPRSVRTGRGSRPLGDLQGLVAGLKELQSENVKLRRAIEKIRDLIDGAV